MIINYIKINIEDGIGLIDNMEIIIFNILLLSVNDIGLNK